MTATAGTTIEGVSVLSRQDGRAGDHFDIALSRGGIEVRRHGVPAQLMSWDHVSQWEIEEHDGYVLLTLRSRGATTPLVVPGWTLDDLEVLMRDVTSDPAPYSPDAGVATAPGVPERVEAGHAPPATTVRPQAAAHAPMADGDHRTAPVQPQRLEQPQPQRQSRAERRRQRRRHAAWKPVVAVVLLGALAAGVTLVLLQSAGVINWGFLGPVA
jgi:hypothetical protein